MFNEIEEKMFNEMIKVCFSNNKKRKKFQRVFKSWTQEERDGFLNGIDICGLDARELRVYYNKKYNELYFWIICPKYTIKYITRLYYDGELYSEEVPFECPLV
jgi:hypothetical protein